MNLPAANIFRVGSMISMQEGFLQKNSPSISGGEITVTMTTCGVRQEDVAKKIGLVSKPHEIKAQSIINDLFAADAKLHRPGFHQHQMASVDTLFDILGSIHILDRHGFLDGEIYGTSPVLGSGFTRIANGEISCPAPVTLEILCRHQVPYSAFPADVEMSTPTGIAIFANITERIVDAYPPMTPAKTGYGTGSRVSRGGRRS